MTITEIEDFLQQLISDITGKKVIWEHQDAPRPHKPYITLRLFSLRSQGHAEILDTETPGEIEVRSQKEDTLSIQWIGPGAMDGLSQLEQSFYKETIADRCAYSGIVIFDVETIMNITGLMDGVKWEERANMDAHVRFSQSVTDDPGYIETVIITDTTEINGVVTEEEITITIGGGT